MLFFSLNDALAVRRDDERKDGLFNLVCSLLVRSLLVDGLLV